MAVFSKASNKKLSSCLPEIQEVMNRVILDYDIIILCGFRNEAEQEKAFREGFSKARWGKSKHNTYPSRAIDIAPYPWNKYKDDPFEFYKMAAFVLEVAGSMGIKLQWGGNWKIRKASTLIDLPHFELSLI